MHRGIYWTALVLVIVGGINWGLIGLFEFNLVNAIFGAIGWLERLIYTLVGVAAVVMIYYAARTETPMRSHRHEPRRA